MRDPRDDQENRQTDGSDSVHGAMIQPLHAWALEQNDRRLVYASGAKATMFAESHAFGVAQHRLPVWKVVLPVGGQAELLQPGRPMMTAAGLIVPPQLAHTCAATSSYVALFIDSWLLPPGSEPTRLDATEVRRLLSALGAGDSDGPSTAADLAAGYIELRALTGAPPALDPRVAHAVRLCSYPDPAGSVASVAAEVGLSAPRLRALVRQGVGIPLTRLRQWGRLRAAIADLPATTVAMAAATAGFADQAHLTRTARDLMGRTPASIRCSVTAQDSRSSGEGPK
ncbi:helix-turn-helix domain-containing protein [Nonomuraea sp. NPDC050202]|uniref:helix-turn-helix domain-containing protein n=1 Tax=Nonomuraea sp. NPDC050202 TaxID=3155035 RepID=UPI00340BF448